VRTPLTGADVNGLTGIVAHCATLGNAETFTPPDLLVSVSGGNVTVTGDLEAADLPEGVTCEADATVIPCLLVVATIAQDLALAFPIANVTTASVAGPFALLGAGVCAPQSAPPASCPVTRVGEPTAFGGIGFVPATNDETFILFVTSGGTAPGSTNSPPENFTAVAAQLCTGLLATSSCSADISINSGEAGVNEFGQLQGLFSVNSGVAPGDYFVKVTATHYIATGAAPTTIVQTQLAPLRVLRTGGPIADDFTINPTSGGVGATTVATLNNLDPYATVTLEVLDPLGSAISEVDVTADGLGTAVSEPLNVQYPATTVRATGSINDEFDVVGEADDVAYLLTRAFDSQDLTECAAEDECSIGVIVTVEVLPGNVSLYAEENEVEVPEIDLASIELSDPDSWYVVSEPGATSDETPILMGDFTGTNSGFVVTAGSNPLLGGEQSSNTIPAEDVWIVAAECDAIDQDNELNETLGVATAGGEQDPGSEEALENELAEAEYELCAVDPDANGRVGGVFFLVFEVSIAGRPVTAIDEYAGLITLTMTLN
jgi:hypothetical protein